VLRVKINRKWHETFLPWSESVWVSVQFGWTKNQTEKRKTDNMQNVNMTVKGKVLTITVDLSKRLGKSASGKTTIVATTSGNQPVPGGDGVIIGLNLYTKEDN
jgi:hypothetical protein